jgi:hypothetical protein
MRWNENRGRNADAWYHSPRSQGSVQVLARHRLVVEREQIAPVITGSRTQFGDDRARLPRQGDTEILPVLQHLASGNFPDVFLDLSLGEFRPLAFLSGASLCLQ